MDLSNRFLNLTKQQLSSFEADGPLDCLVVYLAHTKEGESPSLEAVSYWPIGEQSLPPVESDPELRAPSSSRRWYPLQDGQILLGVLRAELKVSKSGWPDPLDQRLQATAAALTNSLALELERTNLLKELNEQREQIGLMVHQLRNPLTALRTYAQLLLRRLEPESNQRVLVEGLLNEQDQLSRYISALDQIGQPKLFIEAGSSSPLLLPPVLPKTLDVTIRELLNPLIDRAAATANLQSRNWNGPSIWPDWSQELKPYRYGVVAEIIANLIENAFRYSQVESSIGLDLKGGAICVWDNGKPISKDEREKIFEKGYRGQSSYESQGSGVGLALGRKLAEQLGGKLDLLLSPNHFDEQLPTLGNAFVLSLPEKSLPESEE